MPRKPDPAADNVSALQRGFEVLDCFVAARAPLGNGEVALATGIPRPTVSRLIGTLVALGHLRPAREGDKYELGPGLVRLAQAFFDAGDIRAYARPHLRALAEASGGSAFLGVREGDEVLIVEAAKSRSAVAVLGADVGTRMSLVTSALGRAWLAGSSQQTREAVIERLRKSRKDVPAGAAAALQAALAEAQRTGYTVSLGEWNPGTNAAAVPLRTASGETMTINCGGPAFVITPERLREVVVPALVATVAALAREIGGQAGLALTAAPAGSDAPAPTRQRKEKTAQPLFAGD